MTICVHGAVSLQTGKIAHGWPMMLVVNRCQHPRQLFAVRSLYKLQEGQQTMSTWSHRYGFALTTILDSWTLSLTKLGLLDLPCVICSSSQRAIAIIFQAFNILDPEWSRYVPPPQYFRTVPGILGIYTIHHSLLNYMVLSPFLHLATCRIRIYPAAVPKYIYIYINTCDICVYVYIYTHYIHIYIYIWHMYIIHIYIYMYICIYLCKYVRIQVHMYLCIYIYTYIYTLRVSTFKSIYIYIHTLVWDLCSNISVNIH